MTDDATIANAGIDRSMVEEALQNVSIFERHRLPLIEPEQRLYALEAVRLETEVELGFGELDDTTINEELQVIDERDDAPFKEGASKDLGRNDRDILIALIAPIICIDDVAQGLFIDNLDTTDPDSFQKGTKSTDGALLEVNSKGIAGFDSIKLPEVNVGHR